MSFIHYRIVLKLLSPLHVGKRKYGNLMETRDYVPGKTLWGALTARITRDFFDGNPTYYEMVGNFIKENFRISYFWPSLDEENPYFPWKHEDFDYILKSSYMGQPIDYSKKSTEEGQLHEVEYISSKTRYDKQVYLMGDLWIKDKVLKDKPENGGNPIIQINDKEILFKNILNRLQIGGEKGYGWGKVGMARPHPTKNHRTICGVEFYEEEEEIILKFSNNDHLFAHALAAPWENLSPVSEGVIQGPVEPLTGYEFRGEKFEFPNPPICYVPGAQVKKGLELVISPLGILYSKLQEQGEP